MKRRNCRRSAQGSEGGRLAITCANVSLSIVEDTNANQLPPPFVSKVPLTPPQMLPSMNVVCLDVFKGDVLQVTRV